MLERWGGYGGEHGAPETARALDLDGKPQRPQRVQRGVTIAEPDGFLEEDGHGQYAREPAP